MVFFKKILKNITNHHVLSLILSLIIFLPFLISIPKIKTVSSVDDFKLDGHPDFIFYDQFKETFGNDEFFVIAFEDDTIFNKENLTMLLSITNDLESLEEVRKVKSLANIDDLEGSEDYFEVNRFLKDIPEKREQLKVLEQKAVSNKLYLSNLISPDAKTTAIIVYTYDKPDNADYRKNVILKTNLVLDKYRNNHFDFHLAGWTKINNDLSVFMEKDTLIFIPVTYLLITLLIWLFFKNIRLTVIAVLNISICLISTMGLFAVSGITLNNVTSIVPSLIMALALSDTIHIFSHLEIRLLNKHSNKRDALFSVLSKVVVPCFLTTLTTAVGFASLMTSELGPIRDFGFIASCGMVFEFLFSFLFLPSLILFCDPGKIFTINSENKGMNRFLLNLSRKVKARSKAIVVCGILVCLTAFWFAGKITVETNFIKYFKKHSNVRTSIDFVEKKMSGVGSLDISFLANEMDAFKDPENLRIIMDIQSFLDSQKEVDVTLSLVDFIKDMNESFHNEEKDFYRIPENRQLISQYLLLYDSGDIEDFVNESYNQARISARLSIHSSSVQRSLINKTRDYIKKINDSNDLKIRVTGKAVQDVTIIDSLVKGQVSSLFLATCIIGLCMFIIFKSWALGMISFIPNLFPLLINFGIMGFSGIALNTATALISAVALGIVVDDTIHFITEYRAQRSQGKSKEACLEKVITTKGRAIISTSLILSGGFAVLVLSSFVPTIQFGFLSALIMLTAVIGDLILLPAILLYKK
ncbi:MAG: MMPL family transporter [Desulfobacula sp.]|nr:MMPL family transporter [Desulfobacula sp.]